MRCRYFESSICQSCALLPMTYEQSIAIRFAALQRLFPFTPLEEFVPVSQTIGSRIRAKLAVSGTTEHPEFGFWDDQRSLVAVERCPLHHPAINAFTVPLRRLITDARLMPYDVENDRGELKFVVLTWSPSAEQMMVQLVLRSRESVDRIVSSWKRYKVDSWSQVAVLSINLQPARSSQIAGDEDIGISDEQRLPIRFGSTELLFGPKSFLQTNYEIATALYARVASELRTQGTKSLLDLYCGVGAFSLSAGTDIQSVVGIDISENAIDNAKSAATINRRKNASFLCQSLNSSVNPDQFSSQSFDTVICNPPRRGLDAPGMDLIRRTQPVHLIYSSCNPVTLQRDVSLLEHDFQLQKLIPFDMFPFTHHCEVLALLKRKA
ncbi:MAG: 23S rRNA (uracil(1939)-C(5))-methyltransferase RlmD [Planctomycetota bacterium]